MAHLGRRQPFRHIIKTAIKINLRLTQEPVRTLIVPTDANLRLTQEPVRTLIVPTDANLRLTQMVVRTLRLSNRLIVVPMDGLNYRADFGGIS